MKKKIIYPAPELIIEYNILILQTIKIKKADRAEVLSYKKIVDVIEDCKRLNGDVYNKATCLLKGLVQKHPFASGNRRTAFLVTKQFMINNKVEFRIKDNPDCATVMRGIREGFYTDEEIKEWIKNGQIREFKR